MMVRFRKPKKLLDLKTAISLPTENNNEQFRTDLSTNEQLLKDIFQSCFDFVIRPINIEGKPKILLIYLDGLTDTKTLENVLLKPMLFEGLPSGLGELRTIG